MEVSEFCIMAKWHPSQCLQYLDWPMHLPSHHPMHAHCFHGELQCEDTLFKLQQIFPTETIPGIDGDTIHVDSVLDFWVGEWTKGYLV